MGKRRWGELGPRRVNTGSLTAEQIHSFHENGYIVVDRVLADSEVGKLREICESKAVMNRLETMGHSKEALHTLEITTWHPSFLELAKNPKIVELARSLLGNDIQLHHSKLATKPPAKGRGPIAWHQDYSYFPHTNFDLVAVMVMLDDATPQNGCMQMLKGSHRRGVLNLSTADFHADREEDTHHWSNRANIGSVQPKAGGVSIHHCLTLHSSPPNLSGKSRRGIVFEYRACDAYQLAGGVYKDTGILICGDPPSRVRCDAGTVEISDYLKQISNPYFPRNSWHQEGELAEDGKRTAEAGNT